MLCEAVTFTPLRTAFGFATGSLDPLHAGLPILSPDADVAAY